MLHVGISGVAFGGAPPSKAALVRYHQSPRVSLSAHGPAASGSGPEPRRACPPPGSRKPEELIATPRRAPPSRGEPRRPGAADSREPRRESREAFWGRPSRPGEIGSRRIRIGSGSYPRRLMLLPELGICHVANSDHKFAHHRNPIQGLGGPDALTFIGGGHKILRGWMSRGVRYS